MPVAVVDDDCILFYDYFACRLIAHQKRARGSRFVRSIYAQISRQCVQILAPRRVDVSIRSHVVKSLYHAAEDVGDCACYSELIRPDFKVFARLRLVFGFDAIEQSLRVHIRNKFQCHFHPSRISSLACLFARLSSRHVFNRLLSESRYNRRSFNPRRF